MTSSTEPDTASNNEEQYDGDVIRLAQHLIRLDTVNPPGDEGIAAYFLADRLRSSNVEVDIHTIAPQRANIVARLRGTGRAPGLMLSGHLDTVPADPASWTESPWSARIGEGRLWGRGALDMKGALAAMVVAFERVAASGLPLDGDLVLAFTASEETDSAGAAELCETQLLDGVELAVIGEPTDLGVAVAHRGAMWVEVAATGQPGHGSQPDVGVNAVRALLDWLYPIDEIERLVAAVTEPEGGGSVSLNVIAGGRAPNMIPERAAAVLDFRTVEGMDHDVILKTLRGRAVGDLTIRVLRDAPPIAIAPEHPLAVAAVDAVVAAGVSPVVRRMPYVTDGSVFDSLLGIKSVILGPGTEADAHINDESVKLADLTSAAKIYQLIAAGLLVHR
jgi:succinyl-diaminopimelate desuccinylase